MEKKREWKDFEIEVFGSVYKVHFTRDKIDNDPNEFCDGWHNGSTKDIIVSLVNEKGEDMPDFEIQTIVLHEFVHAILCTFQFIEENGNEPLVETLGRGFALLLKQGLYDKIQG